MDRDVTQARVAAVVAMDADPVRRNYEITQAYADISRAFRDALHLEEANWCTFATWASATAGDFIRADEVPQFLLGRLERDDRFSAKLARLLAERDREDARPAIAKAGVFRLVEKVALDVALEIAAGNLKVFRELAPAFVEMIDLYRGCSDPPKPADVKKHMKGKLRAGPSTVDGQSRLLHAFQLYARAAESDDPTRRSQWVLHANALVGFHEQIRLQPAIEGGLMAPFDVAIDEAVDIAAEIGVFAPVKARIRATLRALLDGRFRADVARLRALYRDALTEMFMTLAVPSRTIRLGEDVKYPKGGLPEALRKKGILARDVELSLLLEGYGALTDGEEDSGARDWTRITDRMVFIVDLFRANQRAQSLFDEPFSEEERRRLAEGRLPERARLAS